MIDMYIICHNKQHFEYLNDFLFSKQFQDWGQQQLQGTLFGRFAQAGLETFSGVWLKPAAFEGGKVNLANFS